MGEENNGNARELEEFNYWLENEAELKELIYKFIAKIRPQVNNEKGSSSAITEENALNTNDLEGSKIANEINSNNNVPKTFDLSKMSKFLKNIPRTKEQEEARKAKIIKQYQDKIKELEERKKINELRGMVNEAQEEMKKNMEEKKRLNEEKKKLQNEKRNF